MILSALLQLVHDVPFGLMFDWLLLGVFQCGAGVAGTFLKPQPFGMHVAVWRRLDCCQCLV
jgi:hypothetical protein